MACLLIIHIIQQCTFNPVLDLHMLLTIFGLILGTPCQQKMADGGKLPAEKFTVTESQDGTVYTITPNKETFGDKKAEFDSVVVTVTNAKEVKGSPVNKNGETVGDVTTVPVNKPDETTPQTVVVVFTSTKPTEAIQIVVVKQKQGEKPSVTLISVVACLPEDG